VAKSVHLVNIYIVNATSFMPKLKMYLFELHMQFPLIWTQI